MIKKLYYTVEKELQDIDGFEETTGNKTITCYYMINNEPKIFCEIETQNTENSEVEIQEYLDNNGYEDEEFDFIIL